MKLISRKAAIAAITAAAVTAGTMTAPAMADKKPANPPANPPHIREGKSHQIKDITNAIIKL